MCIIRARNAIIGFCYRNFLKPILFLQDPEKVHNTFIKIGKLLGSNPVTRTITKWKLGYHNKILEQRIDGIHFSNPVGLAAGFDKNGEMTNIMPAVGFGFMEIGAVTGEPCEGNPKPRLWRLKKDKALQVNYGLANKGAEEISHNLLTKRFGIPLGINIAKTNCKETCETEKGIADYAKAYELMRNIGHYDTLNISCPNTFGGRPFTDPKKLGLLLKEIRKTKCKKPLYIKLSPDMSNSDLDKIIALAKKYKVAGFVCTNLTKKDTEKFVGKGGVSGKFVEKKANEQISYVYQKTKGSFTIIGVGGISRAEDAYAKIKLGADLVQLMTGMIYEGPQLISSINEGIVRLMKKDGFKKLKDVRGSR